ncbi:MAG: CoA-binding protein [Halobacteria archaeon]
MPTRSLKDILSTSKTIAVVGCSTDPTKAAHDIPRYMKEQGYRIIPVHPKAPEILGERAYPSLEAIPEKVDVVNVFRPSEEAPAIVAQAAKIGARAVWMQSGIESEEARSIGRRAGLEVVMDRCIGTEHRRMFGR